MTDHGWQPISSAPKDKDIERVAKALCEASGAEWRTGTYPIASGPNFEWEDHDADRLNNHWRYKARAAIEAFVSPPPSEGD
jgi:hypothetical protein